MLRKLAELTRMRVLANEKPQCHQKQLVHFITAGQLPQNCPTQDRTSVLAPGNDWSMRADLNKQPRFPTDITTTLRPDIVLWSATEKRVLIVKLTVPCEEGKQEVYERKQLHYAELGAEVQGKSWRATTDPVKAGCSWHCEPLNQALPEKHWLHVSRSRKNKQNGEGFGSKE